MRPMQRLEEYLISDDESRFFHSLRFTRIDHVDSGLAFHMQTEAPAVQDISGKSQATLELYGINEPRTEDFGRQCLLARRFVENGVRFVQRNLGGWDQHYDLSTGLPN